MARQIMRTGYYWMTLEDDCINYVLPTSLNVMVSLWPFSMLGMDVIGPITPKASNGHHFIFVVIDYFIKWVEAASYASVMKSVVAHFIKREGNYMTIWTSRENHI